MKTKYTLSKKYTTMYLTLALITLISCSKENISYSNVIPYSEGTAVIARWKDNKIACLSLNFDDATPGQATLAIPAMNEKKIRGTFYINPGRENFQLNKNVWEISAPANGHELANHTMTHTGASTYDETIYEVGEASKIIWNIRGHDECGSLIAFNRGGGTSWNETDLAKVLIDYCNFDRQEPIGEAFLALSVKAGSNARDMYRIVPELLKTGKLGRCHFHGIAANNGIPPKDSGNAGVWIKEFISFLEMLKLKDNEIWIAPFGETFKYVKERKNSTLNIIKESDVSYALSLNCTLDENYYDLPLTIVVCVPKTWSDCTVNYNGNQESYPVNNGFVMFDAKPNNGQILVAQN